MKLRPVDYNAAPENVCRNYDSIMHSLGVTAVLLFFQYIGAFPHYLSYITPIVFQLNKNRGVVNDLEEYTRLVTETLKELFPLPHSLLKTEYSIYRDEMRKINQGNAHIAYLFVALRETVKSWGVANKQVSGKQDVSADSQLVLSQSMIEHSAELNNSSWPLFLNHSYYMFTQIQKNERLLFFRVKLEELLLASLAKNGNPMYSPINVVLKLVKDEPNFGDLIYLLGEHFPRYAVERWMFSSWVAK